MCAHVSSPHYTHPLTPVALVLCTLAPVLCTHAQSIAKSMPRALQCVDKEGEERLAAER